jgi:thiamine biosynthesis protein ThiI
LISTAEFTLKSQPVRQLLIRLLKRHVRFNAKRVGLDKCDIKSAGGFLVVGGFDDPVGAAKILARILGVAYADACERTSLTMDEIVACTARLAEEKMRHRETFAVRARNFEPSSLKGKEIEIRAGAEILARLRGQAKVDLDKPDHTFRVFFGANDAFISGARLTGPGGLPVGSQGKLMGLAIDCVRSPLAFYLMMKRGAMVWPVIPNLKPLLGGVRPEAVLNSLVALTPFVPKNGYSAYRIELDEEASKVLNTVDGPLQRIFSTRLALRTITYLPRNRATLGLVTGDLFGHADLEALGDLRLVDEIAKFPIYRPLLTLDQESVNRQLADLGLPTLTGTERPEYLSPAGFSNDSVLKLQDLEKRVEAEQIAQRIAANVTKVPIQAPSS